MHKAAQAYFETQVNTTSQGKLLLMLYDGAIKFLAQAKAKIAEKDYAQKGILISKAIDVISELDSSLNPAKGGELAEKMHGLYFFCNTRLLKANMDMDPSLIDEVIKILSGLRSAYAQIIPGEAAALDADKDQGPKKTTATPAPKPVMAMPTPEPTPKPEPAPEPETAPAPQAEVAPGPAPAAPTETAKPESPKSGGRMRAGVGAYQHIAGNT